MADQRPYLLLNLIESHRISSHPAKSHQMYKISTNFPNISGINIFSVASKKCPNIFKSNISGVKKKMGSQKSNLFWIQQNFRTFTGILAPKRVKGVKSPSILIDYVTVLC